MVSIRWIQKRKAHWERLEQLVQRSANGVSGLGHAELRELGRLYRQTAADLSFVLEDASSAQLAAYLNHLLGRSHNLIYFGRRAERSRLVAFFTRTYPRIFLETLPMTALATATFLAAALAGSVVTLHDPGFARRILGPQMMDTIERREM